MAVKKFKPVTPGQRLKLIVSTEGLSKVEPEKSLLEPYRKSGGRNNSGKMTMRYIGGGHKKMYRIIDFKRDKDNMAGKVATIEYDPNRTGYIAKLVYEDGEKRYILAPEGLQVGQTLLSGPGVPPEIGNCLTLA